MIAHALTTFRLLTAGPVSLALARPGWMPPGMLIALLCGAMASDYLDGRVARLTNTASSGGRLFDHATDFVFVTAGLAGGAAAGSVTPLLPPVIVVAFSQYVLDSYLLHRQKQLRMSAIGRVNGILYFVPLVVLAVSRLELLGGMAPALRALAAVLSYALVAATLVSIVDRASAPRALHT